MKRFHVLYAVLRGMPLMCVCVRVPSDSVTTRIFNFHMQGCASCSDGWAHFVARHRIMQTEFHL